MDVANYVNTISCTLTLLFLSFILYWAVIRRKYNLPPGPTGVPILGYIPFLGKEPYKKLAALKEIYGNVFSIRLGLTDVIILGDYEAVKEVFGKSLTTDRPPRLFDFMPDGVGLSSVNGSEWNEQRRFCIKCLKDLGVGRSKWELMLQDEVEDFVKLISSYKGCRIDISQDLSTSISNNICSFVFGKRYSLNDPNRKFLNDVLYDVVLSFNQDNIFNFFPILRDICIALGIGESSKTHRKLLKFNNFMKKEVKNIKASYKTQDSENFISDYLKETDSMENKSFHYFNDRNLIGNIQALFIAGSDTTRTSIQWLLLIMANYPAIQAEVHKELDVFPGKHIKIDWSDRKKVPYTYAVILEAQRWRTIAPLNTARLAKEDFKIQEFHIPKGTTIIANNWGLHNDRKYWKSPEIFNPHRFLTEDGTINTRLESYVPFSYGKRNCPGETTAMMEILLYIVGLMQKFKVSAPTGKKLKLDGILGLTYQPLKQELVFVERD